MSAAHPGGCTVRHRTYAAAARCAWPPRKGHQVLGEGRYVTQEDLLCACCGPTKLNTLHATREAAQAHLDSLNAEHAGGRCCGSCTQTARMIALPPLST